MRAACDCGSIEGTIVDRNGQDVVYCLCGRYQYCAPRRETGREQRSVRTRPQFRPSQRARVLDRDNGLCVVCGAGANHVGHLLSVEDGKKVGAPEELIWSDDNLAAMCEECNLGWGSRSLNPRLVYRVLMAHQKQRDAGR